MFSPDRPTLLESRPQAVSRRFALKAATDAAHARVEEVIRSAGMFASVDGYRCYVAATLEMRRHYETLLDMNGADTFWPDWPRRRIAGVVARDLADLGGAPPADDPVPGNLLSRGELLSVMYVLEGSSLGARLLVRIAGDLGLTAGYGARHLHAQARDTGAWRSFVDLLESSPVAPCHQTAIAVFERFADAYRRTSL